jgi:hypothetical protein
LRSGNFEPYFWLVLHDKLSRRVQLKIIIRVLLLLAVAALPVQAKEIAGITMPATLDADGVTLKLNGAGIRTMVFMDIYVGGLYLESPGHDAEKIIMADEPMAMRLHMVSGMITSEKMEDATMDGFKLSLGNDIKSMEGPIDNFLSVFREPISEGDVFDIIWIPGKGVDVNKNGTFKGTTTDGGLPFKQALWRIWLGKEPVHKKLKAAMLGK